MGAHDDVSLGRSPSIDSRDTLSRSDSQRKSHGRSLRGQRSGNDLFVCFAPRTSLSLVPRPVLSPAREKGKEPGRRTSALSSSIFSRSAKKQGFEGEEPTSPKVTCIGQVRVKHKEAKSCRSTKQDMDIVRKGKQPSFKSNTGSESPGRSSASPSTRGLASGSKKEHNSSACPSFGKDFLCFGLPCDPHGSFPSFRGDKKSCGTVFAKSLVLIQETDGKSDSKTNAEKQTELHATSSSSEHMDVLKTIHLPKGRQDLANSEQITVEEEVEAEIPTEATAAEAHISNTSEEHTVKEQEEPISETQEEEEEDTFEPEPPPPNALLLMRRKVEHGQVVVPLSPKIKLKRSTSAPAQCRVRSSSNKGDNRKPETDAGSGKENRHFSKDQQDKSSRESSPIGDFIQKSFLKRCKSVSESVVQSNSLKALSFRQHIAVKDKEKLEAMPQDVKQTDKIPGDTNCIVPPKMKDEQAVPDLINSGSGKRSEREAQKVSLDIVPETWLWQSCTVVRPRKDENRPDKQGMKWLDEELEASLWKNCKVATEPRKDTEFTCQETAIEGQKAAEFETSRLESCQRGRRPEDSRSHLEGIEEETETDDVEGASSGRASLCRSSSLGSQLGQESGCTQVEEEGSRENPGRDCDLIKQVEMGNCDLEGRATAKEDFMVQCDSLCIVEDEGEPARELTTIRPNNQEIAANPDELDQHKLSQELHKSGDSREAEGNAAPSPVIPLANSSPFSQFTSPSPASTPAPAQAQAQGPMPAPDTLLVLRYNLKAIRISLDAPEYSIKFTEGRDHHQHQQKAMLKAVSHFHEVGRCARLLKAASGRERDPLASAIRLQRCKSEPVRLTS